MFTKRKACVTCTDINPILILSFQFPLPSYFMHTVKVQEDHGNILHFFRLLIVHVTGYNVR